MNIFKFFILCFSLVLTAYSGEKPNVIIILTDDQGWGDLSLSGNKDLETPNIDSIAKGGAQFINFYVAPVCSPTRAEFLTGRYSFRCGVYSTSKGGERIDLDEVTIADTFKAAGYKTGAFGKWHSGMQYPYHPNGRGFDEYYGFCSGHWGNYFNPVLEHNGRLVKGNGFCVDDFTEKAMTFIESNKDNSFFVYLAYNTPHSPMQVPDKFWNKFKNKKLQMKHNTGSSKKIKPDFLKAALAMCENIDWNVGRILKKLDDLGIAENTIVLFFSDNGPNSKRWNGGMKGKKGSRDEGGVRSPLVMRWPAKIKAGIRVEKITSAIDLLPSLASMTGTPLISKKPLDGVNFEGLLTDKEVDWNDKRLVANVWSKKFSIRSQKFRLDERGDLYDIENDRGQQKVVSEEYPAVTVRLKAVMEDYKKQYYSELPKEDPRPFVICHKDFPYTQIPARDGKVTGGIRRSNRWPNCSYFTNWIDLNGTISFDVEVQSEGEYEVEIYYTCSKGSEGSTFEVRVGSQAVKGVISEAHDPPETGMEHDRSVRMESYVKDFKPLKVGVIKLSKGKAVLTLKALTKPGTQVMDFRLLMLKKVQSK